jgi:ABC-type transport system substrate-binding protein
MTRLKVFGLLTVAIMMLPLIAGCGAAQQAAPAVATKVVAVATALPQPTAVPPTAAPPPTEAPKPTEAPPPTAAPAADKFVIATDAAFPPMEYVDESKAIVGLDMDLIAAIAKDQGFEYEIKNTAWDGIFAGLEGGEYDGILSSVTITDERKKVYDFSDPYINAGQAVVVRADEAAIASDKDLGGKTVGAQIGTTGAFAVEKIEGTTLKQYDTIDLALLDLVNKNLDAVVVDTPVAADYALASPQFKGKLKIVGAPFTEEFYGLTVQRGDPSGLAAKFNAGLKNVKASGEFDKIYAKWIGTSAAISAGAAAADPCAYGGEIKSIEALDDMTVQFTLCFPDGAFPAKAADTGLQIWPAEVLKAGATSGGKEWLDKPVGTGPYKLKEWRKGDQMILEANPDYWGEKPAAQTVVFRWSSEAAQRLLELQSGNVNGIDNPGPDDFATIEGDENLQLQPRGPVNIFYVGMNNTYPPFDNEKVRQALAMAIDRKRIVDNFYPEGSILATQFMPPSIFGYTEGLDWYAVDPAKAKEMLTEAGVYDADGKWKIKLFYRDVVRGYLPEPGVVAQDIQAQLAEIGVDLEIVVMESGAYLDAADAGELNGLHLLGWGADYPDATNFVDYHFGAGSSKQFGAKWEDITTRLAKAAAAGDADERLKIYAEANELIKQHAPMIPVAHGASATAWAAACKGAHASPLTREKLGAVDCGADTLVFMQNAEPISLYCPDETDGETFRACEQINEALLGYKVGTTEIEPGLAESYESNAEGTVWTFKLRPGVKWHDGSTLDAEDVLTSWTAQWDAASPLHTGRVGDFTYFKSYFTQFLNAPEN